MEQTKRLFFWCYFEDNGYCICVLLSGFVELCRCVVTTSTYLLHLPTADSLKPQNHCVLQKHTNIHAFKSCEMSQAALVCLPSLSHLQSKADDNRIHRCENELSGMETNYCACIYHIAYIALSLLWLIAHTTTDMTFCTVRKPHRSLCNVCLLQWC